MLFEASQDRQHDAGWIARPSILLRVSERITFAADDLDSQRTSIILRYQKQLDDHAKEAVTNILLASLRGTRTRSLDTQAKEAIEFLRKLDSMTLGVSNLDNVATVLVEQVNAHGNYNEKAMWLAPLINIRSGLSSGVQSQVDSLYQPQLLEAPDPNGLIMLLSTMGLNTCQQLLEIPSNIQALHDQAQKLELRFNVNQSPGLREQILNCFPATAALSKVEIFDGSRTWDLGLFAKILARGVQEQAPFELLKRQTVAFIETYLIGKSSSHPAVLDGLIQATHQSPDLLDEAVARSLSSCSIEIVGANVDKRYADLRFLSTKLGGASRLWLIRELVENVLKPRQAQWVQVLQRISEDLHADETIANEKSLVSELSDYAFEAARVSPSEAQTVFLNLLPHAGPELRDQNVDEALDRLLVLESQGSPADQMQPYLALVKAAGSPFTSPRDEKVERFVLRMLGHAKSDTEKSVVLQFLDGFTSLPESVLARINELADGDGEIADFARKLSGTESHS